jgi:hypothetical protein
MAFQDREEQRPIAAADVDDPAEFAELVFHADRGIGALGEALHSGIE